MQLFDWNQEKNELLKNERQISFEEIVFAINNNCVLEVKDHPNKEKYSNQKIYVVHYNDYVYLVPFVIDEETHFLKTIIPSRKDRKNYLGDSDEKKA